MPIDISEKKIIIFLILNPFLKSQLLLGKNTLATNFIYPVLAKIFSLKAILWMSYCKLKNNRLNSKNLQFLACSSMSQEGSTYPYTYMYI